MLYSRADYLFVTQNAMARIAIEGKPYPVRPEKLVLLGEDVAFVREATGERNYYAQATTYNADWTSLSVGKDGRTILDVQQSVAGAIDALRQLLTSSPSFSPWRRGVEAEAFSPPSGVAFSATLTSQKQDVDRNEVQAVKNACNTELASALAELETAYESACSAAVASASSAAATRDSAATAADAALAAALAEVASALVAEKSALQAEHEANVARIKSEYADDPARLNMAIDAENDAYALRVAAAESKAGRDQDAARSDCNAAKFAAEEVFYDAVKSAWTACDEACGTALAAYVARRDSARSSAATALSAMAESYNYSGWAFVDSNIKSNDGWNWNPAVWAMEAAREAMLFDPQSRDAFHLPGRLLVEKYLSRTPSSDMARAYVGSVYGAKLAAIAHRPAADALAAIYDDLNSAYAMEPPSRPDLWRKAYQLTYTWQGGSSTSEVAAHKVTSREGLAFKEQGSGTWGQYAYSNMDFYIDYGKRYEVDQIKAIYATVAVEAKKHSGSDSGAWWWIQRVQLVDEGPTNAEGVASLDECADILANMLNLEREEHVENMAAITAGLDSKIAEEDARLASGIADADDVRRQAVQAAGERFDATVGSAAEATNEAVANAQTQADADAARGAFALQVLYPEQATRSAEVASAESAYKSTVESLTSERASRIQAYKTQTYNPAMAAEESRYNGRIQYQVQQAQILIDNSRILYPGANENARNRWRLTPTIPAGADEFMDGNGSKDVTVSLYPQILWLDVVYDMRTSTSTETE